MAGHCRPVTKYRQRLDRIGRVIGSEARREWQTHDWERLPALDPRYCVCVHCHAKRRRDETGQERQEEGDNGAGRMARGD